jgi:hypothetical protein
MNSTIIFGFCSTPVSNSPEGYVIGAVIALFILLYLLTSLIKPKKF